MLSEKLVEYLIIDEITHLPVRPNSLRSYLINFPSTAPPNPSLVLYVGIVASNPMHISHFAPLNTIDAVVLNVDSLDRKTDSADACRIMSVQGPTL